MDAGAEQELRGRAGQVRRRRPRPVGEGGGVHPRQDRDRRGQPLRPPPRRREGDRGRADPLLWLQLQRRLRIGLRRRPRHRRRHTTSPESSLAAAWQTMRGRREFHGPKRSTGVSYTILKSMARVIGEAYRKIL